MATDKTTKGPTYKLTKDDIKAVADFVATYTTSMKGEADASAMLEAAKYGKFHAVRGLGFRACLDATTKVSGEDVYSPSLALAAYDALVEGFNAELTRWDMKNRNSETARPVAEIDRSFISLRSVVRKAIEAGHRIDGTEKKADLQTAAGNKTTGGQTGNPKGRGTGATPGRDAAGKAGDEPATITPAEANRVQALRTMSPKLREVMDTLAAIIVKEPAHHDALAACLVDALNEYRDMIAPKADPVAAAPAAAPAPVLTAAQEKATKGRRRKAG